VGSEGDRGTSLLCRKFSQTQQLCLTLLWLPCHTNIQHSSMSAAFVQKRCARANVVAKIISKTDVQNIIKTTTNKPARVQSCTLVNQACVKQVLMLLEYRFTQLQRATMFTACVLLTFT